MNAPSPWRRPLAALAFVLGVVDVALLLRWWVREPPPPVVVTADAPQPTDMTPPATAEASMQSSSAGGTTERTTLTTESTDTARAVLYGAFARSDGTPVARGVLWLYREDTRVGTESPTEGAYAFAGLRPGDYRLDSRVDDALPMHRTVHVEAPLTRLDLALDPARLLQVHAVTPDGAPLTEALEKLDPGLARIRSLVAAAFAEPLQDDLPLSSLAEVEAGLGTFRGNDVFHRGPPMAKQTIGVLTLPPGQPVQVALLLRSAIVAQLPVAVDQSEVTFTIDPRHFLGRTATVRLRVVDEQGAPLAGCQIALNDSQTGGGGSKSGDDGRLVLEHLVPGRLRLEAWNQNSCAPPILVDVQPGADLDLGDVVLRPGVEVAFTGDFGGQGWVSLTWLDAPLLAGRSVENRHVSADNGTTLRSTLYPGRYAGLAVGEGTGALFEIDTSALPPQPVHLDLQRSASLRLRGGREGHSVLVDVRAANGAVWRRQRYRGAVDVTEWLPLGNYVVTVTDEQGIATPHPVQLSRDGAAVALP